MAPIIKKKFKFIIAIFLITAIQSLPQSINTDKFEYISPVPSSKFNSPKTNIIIRFGEKFDLSKTNVNSLITVTGSKSGKHNGRIVLTEDQKTIIFNPQIPFADNEKVTVNLNKRIKTFSQKDTPPLRFSFKTSKIYNIEKDNLELPKLYSGSRNISYKKNSGNNYFIKSIDSLPADFPNYSIDSINNPSQGNFFFTPFNGNYPNYLVIADNFGIPIFYRKTTMGRAIDLKRQPNGSITYYKEGANQHYVMDSSYNIIDSLHMQNGYSTNLHELVILENGHSLMMGYDPQHVRMDTIVAGGDSNATVAGLIIQELDENKNVIFQWRSWDHFKITDATEDIDLNAAYIDYVHGNAIEVDSDSNILISSRNMDEITKINRQTGEIIWRLGGKYCRNNEFTFTNDPIGFSHQHDIRRLPNGNIGLFDDGNLHSPQFSRAVEYKLDEINKTATLIHDYRNNPETFSFAMGSARFLDSNNVVIGWGYNTDPPSITEMRGDETVFSLTLPETTWSYRALKFPWKTNLFVTKPDTLNFDMVSIGDSLIKSLSVINNSNSEIQINGILNRDSSYQVNTLLPIIIPAFDTSVIKITYKPTVEGEHSENLYLQWNKPKERISQVVHVIGKTDSISTNVKDDQNIFAYSLKQNYPNPFNPSTKINFTLQKSGRVILNIYDILGRKIRTLINKKMASGNHEIKFNAKSLPSGVYIYSLRTNDYFKAKKMILLR